jgi:hypothetical protein
MAIPPLQPYATTEPSKLRKPVQRLNIFTLNSLPNLTGPSVAKTCALRTDSSSTGSISFRMRRTSSLDILTYSRCPLTARDAVSCSTTSTIRFQKKPTHTQADRRQELGSTLIAHRLSFTFPEPSSCMHLSDPTYFPIQYAGPRYGWTRPGRKYYATPCTLELLTARGRIIRRLRVARYSMTWRRIELR